jgi:hypothetical protein
MSYKYSVNAGLVEQKLINMKKLIFGIAATLMIAGGAAVPTFAASDTGYCAQSGCNTSQANSVCAGHGAFGAFSHHTGTWIPADAQEDGGLGHDTGPTNSGLCGNPQNN